MDCRCAFEEYLAKSKKELIDILKCNAEGNFNAMQCFSNNQICYCTDENGAQLSERFQSKQIYDFIKKQSLNIQGLEDLCQVMRATLETGNHIIQKDEQFFFDQNIKNFKIDTKPDQNKIIN